MKELPFQENGNTAVFLQTVTPTIDALNDGTLGSHGSEY
jgi:hypothetical protein